MISDKHLELYLIVYGVFLRNIQFLQNNPFTGLLNVYHLSLIVYL
jgi:hypothetical protein